MRLDEPCRRQQRVGLVGTELHEERPIAHSRVAIELRVEHLGAVIRVFQEQPSVEHGRERERGSVAAAQLAKAELRLLHHGRTHMPRAANRVPERPSMDIGERTRHSAGSFERHVAGKGVRRVFAAAASGNQHDTLHFESGIAGPEERGRMTRRSGRYLGHALLGFGPAAASSSPRLAIVGHSSPHPSFFPLAFLPDFAFSHTNKHGGKKRKTSFHLVRLHGAYPCHGRGHDLNPGLRIWGAVRMHDDARQRVFTAMSALTLPPHSPPPALHKSPSREDCRPVRCRGHLRLQCRRHDPRRPHCPWH